MVERKTISVDDIIIDTLQSRRGTWEGDQLDQALVDSIKGTGLLHLPDSLQTRVGPFIDLNNRSA